MRYQTYTKQNDIEPMLSCELANIVYWRLLSRTIIISIVLFILITAGAYFWLPVINYLKIIDVVILIVIPLVMAELLLKANYYPNKSWNNMLLLTSFLIVLSSLNIFY